MFFVKPAIPALYLHAGENTLELYADWARGGKVIRLFKSDSVELTVSAGAKESYSLEYHIPGDRFILEKYDNPALFKE